jgi:hypothetical protein
MSELESLDLAKDVREGQHENIVESLAPMREFNELLRDSCRKIPVQTTQAIEVNLSLGNTSCPKCFTFSIAQPCMSNLDKVI